jgi:hypothetical protein
LKYRTSKREAKQENKEKRKRERKKKLQKIRNEAFRATRVIYIEPLASRPSHVLRNISERSKEGKDVEQIFF